MLNNATITAPIGGIVSNRFMDEGSMAAPGVPLFTIVDMDKVKAVVNVVEANIGKVSTNSKAKLSVEALQEEIEGNVTLVSPTVKPMSRTATVEITIDNSSHKLKPGMFAKVTIPVKVHEDVIVVHRSAVLEDKASGGKYVFVANNGVCKKREVQVGITRSDEIEILSGLKVGEEVII